jgi:hypothetical protein
MVPLTFGKEEHPLATQAILATMQTVGAFSTMVAGQLELLPNKPLLQGLFLPLDIKGLLFYDMQ